MNINGVRQSGYLEQVRQNKNREKNLDFQKDFLEALMENELMEDRFMEEEMEVGSGETSESMSVVERSEYFRNISTNISVQESGRISAEAVIECAVRNISYAESDNIKACVAQGYVFKAQVQIDKHLVYVEQKNEDGSVKGYEINPLKVLADTQNPLEQMALESWEMARRAMAGFGKDSFFTEIDTKSDKNMEAESEETSSNSPTNQTWEEALAEFYDFVEDRIKNGPPKIQTGGAAWSVEEWNELMDKVDEDIDTVKKELRERIEKKKEEAEEKQRLEEENTQI